MKKLISLGAVLSVVSPLLAFADAIPVTQDVTGILGTIGNILGILMPILITLAAVWFVYNVIMYMISGDEAKKKEAKSGVIQGLIGLFVIIAFWGILSIIMKTFGVKTYMTEGGVVPYTPSEPCFNADGTPC